MPNGPFRPLISGLIQDVIEPMISGVINILDKFRVLNSSGALFRPKKFVLDSDGNSFTVDETVFDSNGNGFEVI